MKAPQLVRLPDINNDRDLERYGYRAYGRFALLRDGSFWFGDMRSSHPRDCMIGWYWAVSAAGELLVSARGARVDGERLFGDLRRALARLMEELRRRHVL
jgi:hypothetical protein